MNNNRSFYAVTRSASEALSSTSFEERFAAIFLTIVSQLIVILTKKTLFKFLWLEFQFKSFLVLHVHF